jgi:hypothetical protein
MQLCTSRKILPNERKQTEKRRKFMELAGQCAMELVTHDWDLLLSESNKVDPGKC